MHDTKVNKSFLNITSNQCVCGANGLKFESNNEQKYRYNPRFQNSNNYYPNSYHNQSNRPQFKKYFSQNYYPSSYQSNRLPFKSYTSQNYENQPKYIKYNDNIRQNNSNNYSNINHKNFKNFSQQNGRQNFDSLQQNQSKNADGREKGRIFSAEQL